MSYIKDGVKLYLYNRSGGTIWSRAECNKKYCIYKYIKQYIICCLFPFIFNQKENSLL